MSFGHDAHTTLSRGDVGADLQIVSQAGLAEKITGGLSITQKMPCPSWGIFATRCQLGSALARKPGTDLHEPITVRAGEEFVAVPEPPPR